MFESLKRFIRRRPWWVRWFIAWPLYYLIWLPFSIIGWMAREIYAGMRSMAKRFIAPLLLPAALIAVCCFVYVAAPEAFGAMLSFALVVGAMWFGVYIMFGGLTRPKKKKH